MRKLKKILANWARYIIVYIYSRANKPGCFGIRRY